MGVKEAVVRELERSEVARFRASDINLSRDISNIFGKIPL